MRPSLIICLLACVCVCHTIPAISLAARKDKEKSWAYQTPKRPNLPTVKNKKWVRNPIDAFILAKLEEKGLAPSPTADRTTLIRRLTFDLTGLPPTVKEIEAFVKDKSPNAYEKVVDRLLASPQYGERWAMYWLDLVRYAESDGFNADGFRPHAWRYRDYVIRSFNEDKPFDRFIREQVAGDEMYPNDPDALIATAFNRHYPDEFNARNIDNRRQEILFDLTDTTGQVFLGLTVGCAKCHDHKYDPISQKDYYALQAFFVGFSPKEVSLIPADKRKVYDKKLADWESKTADIRDKMAKIEAPYRAKLARKNLNKFLPQFKTAYKTPYEKRTPLQKQYADMVQKQLTEGLDRVIKSMKKEDRKQWDTLKAKLKTFDKYKPSSMPKTMVLTDIGPEAPPAHLLKRGNFKNPGEELQPAFLTILEDKQPPIPAPGKGAKTSGRRTVLAKWLSSPDNPLTARVMVNRIWQHHYGRGIVGTASDFGFQGEEATHPELLDWLATEFIAKGWKFKAMHRMMVLSNTYRQQSVNRPEGVEKDPSNTLFWRMNRQRLEGEALRDALLAVSGKLNLKMGGPSVKPPLSKDVAIPRGGWTVSKNKSDHYRRSVYVYVKRNLRYPLFKVFDAPDSNEMCARRHVSTNAPQALTMINGDFVLGVAKSFASKTLKASAGQPSDVVDYVFRQSLGRAPDERERELSLKFLHSQTELIEERLNKKQAVAMPTVVPKGVNRAQAAAVVEFCHVVFNLNEFIYVD